MLRWFACLLAVFCLLAVVRVEWTDYRAGGAIRQKLQKEPEMNWVISEKNDPEGVLRNDVRTSLISFGVALHVVAIVLIFLSLFRQARDGPWRSGWAGLATFGMVLMAWAVHRQYFGVLGW